MSARPLAPRGGNDKVYTPEALATQIVGHFKPYGWLMEPCCGKGAFLKAMRPFSDNVVWHYEIDDGTDFLGCNMTGYNWIITNPPWSQLRAFLNKSMEVADNVVFLCLVNAFFMKARVRDMAKANFGLVEIAYVETPVKPWPQTGFQLGAIYIKRDYHGPVKIGNL